MYHQVSSSIIKYHRISPAFLWRLSSFGSPSSSSASLAGQSCCRDLLQEQQRKPENRVSFSIVQYRSVSFRIIQDHCISFCISIKPAPSQRQRALHCKDLGDNRELQARRDLACESYSPSAPCMPGKPFLWPQACDAGRHSVS